MGTEKEDQMWQQGEGDHASFKDVDANAKGVDASDSNDIGVGVGQPIFAPEFPLPASSGRKVAEFFHSIRVRLGMGRILSGMMQNALSDVRRTVAAHKEVAGLAHYRAQYKNWNYKFKSACSWKEVEARLLANDGHFLDLAESMNEGGVLFGMDKVGNLLIADGGVEPIMTGMGYADTCKAVMFKEIDGKQVPTGYEMFTFSDNRPYCHDKGAELCAFEKFTGENFIGSGTKNKHIARGAWLECETNPDQSGIIVFYPPMGMAILNLDRERLKSSEIGVRRLLRVPKTKA